MNRVEMIVVYEKFIEEYHDRIVKYLDSMDVPICDRITLKGLYTKISEDIKIVIDSSTMDYMVEDRLFGMQTNINSIKEILGVRYLSDALKEINSLPDVCVRANPRYNLYIDNTLLDRSMSKKVNIPFAIAGNDRSYRFDFPINDQDDRAVFIDIAILPADKNEYVMDIFFHIPSHNKIDMEEIKGSIIIGNRHHEFKLVSNRYFFMKSPIHLDHTEYKQENMIRFVYSKYGSEYLEIVSDDINTSANLYIRSISIRNIDKRSDNDISFINVISSKDITIK